ncbi:ATP binding protein [Trachipleistophora hominis]|uniref:ATP binding protein n=1 Tax=Trachipleistophora hominis TaxID=72359 RepID=L7JXB5_TRAHO|nr:ATP binding protein [Trachipleistophora hominis]
MLIDSEVDDHVLNQYKQKRLSELKKALPVPSITSRQSLLNAITTQRCIIHFHNPEFARCRIMDERLAEAADIVSDIKFYRAEAQLFEDVCEYLKINVLPFLGFFRDGKCVDGIVGFEGLSGDDFKTSELVKIIKRSDI